MTVDTNINIDKTLVPTPASSTVADTSSNAVNVTDTGDNTEKTVTNKTTLESRIGDIAKSVETGEVVETKPDVSIQTTKQKILPSDPRNFAELKKTLTKKDEELASLNTKLSELTAQLEDEKKKYTDYETELTTIKPKYQELRDWQTRNELLTMSEFTEQIVIPRQNIKARIVSELKADGIDESVWDQALQVKSRRELEQLVEDNIDSTLLRTQFYQSYFQDMELRNRESEALAKPAEYIERVKNENAQKTSNIRQALLTNFGANFENAKKDASEMSSRLGKDQILELTYIDGNDQHNANTKAIVEAADKSAEAHLRELIEAGVTVDRAKASQVVYLWRQAVAAKIAHENRVAIYSHYNNLLAEHEALKAKHESLLGRANPGTSVSSMVESGKRTDKTGRASLEDRLASIAAEVES